MSINKKPHKKWISFLNQSWVFLSLLPISFLTPVPSDIDMPLITLFIFWNLF